MSNRMNFILVELRQGTSSVAYRFGKSNRARVINGWENMDPMEAARILTDIQEDKISAHEVANKPYREVILPINYD